MFIIYLSASQWLVVVCLRDWPVDRGVTGLIPENIGAATARVGGVRTPRTFGILTLDPPNFWDSNMGPPHGTPPWDPHGTPPKFGDCPWDSRFEWVAYTNFTDSNIDLKNKKLGRKTPSTTPLEFTEPHRLPPPPSKSWQVWQSIDPLLIGPYQLFNPGGAYAREHRPTFWLIALDKLLTV